MNHKKLRRLYREERLQVRRRGGRKRALGTRAPMAMPQGPNQRWSLDFVSRRIRPTAAASASWPWSTTSRGNAWRWWPTPRCRDCGSRANSTPSSPRAAGPPMCVSDNGTELTSMAILRWSQETRVEWHYIAPGKPQQNAFIESFNGRLRDELLNETLFTSLAARARGSGDLEGRLQHRQAAQRARQSAAGRLRQAQRSRHATGRVAALRRGSAPRPVASPSQMGSNEALFSGHGL